MGKNLYVGNLSFDIDNTALEEIFTAYGAVDKANVISDRNTGRSRGFGFVEMTNDDEAQAAIEALDGKEVLGRALKVNEARDQGNRGGGGGRF